MDESKLIILQCTVDYANALAAANKPQGIAFIQWAHKHTIDNSNVGYLILK